MKSAIISLGSGSSMMTLNEMEKYFDEVEHLDIRNIDIEMNSSSCEILYNNEPIQRYDCIYAKGSFRYAALLQTITSTLNSSAYMPIRPFAFEIGHDKLLTQLLLQQQNIPMPATYLSSTVTAAKKILKRLNFPIIMKFPHGTQGKGVMFAESIASANSILDALQALKQPFILQEYVDTDGVDMRLIVVGDKVVAAMKRIAGADDKRANIHAGGRGEAFSPDSITKKIAIKAAKAMGCDICAVDILESPKGPLVIEINLSPGLQGITAATKINVADHIAKYLAEKAKELVDMKKSTTSEKILEDLDTGNGHSTKEILSQIDFRGERMLLPKVITKITGFNEEDEYCIRCKKGKVSIKKFDI
ncbi:RimK family alpha-L-glutamate ligase [Candidatus Woesearchaeota archaeon]|nr:RimK family alpha-L-glutamate ligase [Candidatus Woesearchaeota archaeon]